MLKWTTGSEVNLSYVSGLSPNTFTCQFFDDIPQLNALMEEIATYITSLEAPVPATPRNVGAPVLAKFSEDEVWYRAEVLTPVDSEEKVQVLFVDYGNAELVSVVDTLTIPRHFTALHKLAATYRLGSTSGTTHEEWPEEAFSKFEELAQASECLAATVMELKEDHVVVALKSAAGTDFAESIL